MNRRQFWALFFVVALLSVLVSGCAGVDRINSFFENDEYKEHSKLIDFGLFFTMFFALAYLGLTQVWGKGFGKPGEAKGAIVGLSLALALALAFAVVTQTQFSITTIFPLAKALFFLIIFFILYGLIVMTKIFGDHWGGKIAAAILALMLTYILLSIFTHMVCQMSNNMDDPACQSDFFNWGFNMLGRLFGVEDWTWDSDSAWSSGSGRNWFSGWPGGGGGGGGGGTQAPSDTGPAPAPSPTGEIEGGCRLDIVFDFDSINPSAGAGAIGSYVGRVRAMGVEDVHAYGFASMEGRERYNVLLSGRRARSVARMIEGADPSIDVSTSGKGPNSYFDPDGGFGEGSTNGNRRVVLSTEPVSSFLPAPAPGSLHGCDEEEEEEEEDEGCICPLGFLYRLFGLEPADWCGWNIVFRMIACWWFLLLLLLLFLRRKTDVKVEDVLAMKDEFLKKLERLRFNKQRAWEDIQTVDPTGMDTKTVEQRADELLENLQNEFSSRNWKSLRQIAKDYAKDPNRVIVDGERYGINEQHLKMVMRILKRMKHKYANNSTNAFLRWLKDKKDWAMFKPHARVVTEELIHGNKVAKEVHEFLVLQARLHKIAQKFADNEEKLIVKFRKMRSSTFFGRKFWGTRHIVRRKGFPWARTVEKEEGPLETRTVQPSSGYGLVDVTQAVRDLTHQLIEKIEEIREEADNVQHHASTMQEFNRKYEEEKQLIMRLIEAIKLQKRIMSEEWWPVIDKVRTEQGRMEGHVHYRRY